MRLAALASRMNCSTTSVCRANRSCRTLMHGFLKHDVLGAVHDAHSTLADHALDLMVLSSMRPERHSGANRGVRSSGHRSSVPEKVPHRGTCAGGSIARVSRPERPWCCGSDGRTGAASGVSLRAVQTTKRSLPHRVSVSALPGIGTNQAANQRGLAALGALSAHRSVIGLQGVFCSRHHGKFMRQYPPW